MCRFWLLAFVICLSVYPLAAMEQRWVDDLNARFPKLGDEFQQAVAQKLAQYPPETAIEDALAKLTAHPDYAANQISNTKSFGLHSELLILYPAIGQYDQALHEAQLLRDFVIANPPENQEIMVTFRGVYAELLIVNERYDEALQECAASQTLAPEEEGIYLSRGAAYVHIGDLERVLENLAVLLRAPDDKAYARQLFDFLMLHRQRFQTPQIQANTMIDVMLRDLAPEQTRTSITITAPTPEALSSSESGGSPATPPSITPTPEPQRLKESEAADPLALLLDASQESQVQILGPPVSETLSDATLSQDFQYNGHTLTLTRDRQTQKILSCSMFFLPPVSEIEAFAHIGVHRRNLPPTLSTNAVKAWMPYGPFAKVRISLNAEDVLAIVVQP